MQTIVFLATPALRDARLSRYAISSLNASSASELSI